MNILTKNHHQEQCFYRHLFAILIEIICKY